MTSRTAVTGFFVINGFAVTSFYARLPAVKARLDITNGELGLALLALTAGVLVAQPLVGALTRRGSGPLVVSGALACAATVLGPAFAGSLAALIVAAFALGAATGWLDVAMNVHGVAVERRLGKPILAGLHAAFSVGMFAAAGVAAVAAAAGADVEVHLGGVAAACAAAALVLRGGLLPREVEVGRAAALRRAGDEGGAGADAAPAFARPTRALAGIGAIAFCVVMCEGAVADWSAVHLRETLGASAAAAALGLAAFSVAMTAGRLTGDAVTARIGPVTHVRIGATLAGAGLVTAALAPTPGLGVAGFALAGLGLAALFPLTIRAAAERGGSAPGPSIAAITTTGYVGLVAGPPAVGFLAEATDLRLALAVLLGSLCLVATVLARRLTP